MDISVLKGTLPSAYEYDGRVYEMRTDFREWMKFELLLNDEDICMQDKIYQLKEIVFPEIPEDIQLWDFIMWFYHCGNVREESGGKNQTEKSRSRFYSFEHDLEYIYAAFLEIYGIDIFDVPYLHWWKFIALFKSLHDCMFTDIVGYRSEKITSKTPDYRKKFLNTVKKRYALPRSLSEQQKLDELKKMKEEMGY
ncbi:MAG: bacteriophage Gp15 family protein [Oscillospiraceae bacterium]|nr:bacteriophage Gp15 family protein [Oscillospiraceae bacterium]